MVNIHTVLNRDAIKNFSERMWAPFLAVLAMAAIVPCNTARAQEWVASDMPGLRETVLRIDGEDYLVRDSRSPGPAVLLVHGMPDDGLVWKEQVPALLEAGYRVIVPDTLGNGRKSSRPTDRARFKSDRVAADMVAILDQLGVNKAHYIGHDEGAILGWEFVITYPERVITHVELSVGHPLAWARTSFSMDGARMNWYSFLNSAPNSGDVWRAGNGRLLHLALETHPDRERVFEYMMKPGQAEYSWMFDTVNGVGDFMILYANGVYDDLPKVTRPTLGIIGSTDVAMWLSQMSDSRDYIDAEWQMAVIEAGHWLQLEKPAEVNTVILKWLAAH